MKASKLKYQSLLKKQFLQGQITKKEYKQELKWIRKNIS
jgi:hypothetical protein